MHKGSKLKFDREPVYLGVALYRSPTFKPHLQGIINKTRKRVNLIDKLAGSTWGANFTTIRTSTLALDYSTAEYSVAVWAHSCHTKLVDTVINESLSLITGCLVATPVEMLPVLAGIAPSHGEILPARLPSTFTNPVDAPAQRLRRETVSTQAGALANSNPLSPSWMEDCWANEWAVSSNTLRELKERPSNKPPDHDLPSNAWVRLNRQRSGWAKAASVLAKIGATDSEWCPCGSLQTVHHIINACPLFGAPSGPQGIKSLDPATRAWLETQLPL